MATPAESFESAMQCHKTGDLEAAVINWRQVLLLQPDLAEAHYNLGNALDALGQLDEAVTHWQQALVCRPDLPEAHNNLANALLRQNKPDEAITQYRHALGLRPLFPEAHNNLGSALQYLDRLDEAQACYLKALHLRPDYAEAYANLGCVYLKKGRSQRAVICFRQALQLQPDLASAQSNYLYGLNFDADADPDAVFAEHVRWGKLHEPSGAPPPHDNNPDPDRRLRIGYVSPDFRDHALLRYLEPALAHHDPQRVEVYCYADVPFPDAATARLQKFAQHWCWTNRLTDAVLAQSIRLDGIDILVDLAGHTANNRLAVFALKPAPVQATWLGNLNTTGLTAVDYRLTDAVLDPPGQPVRDTEELFRLPHGMCCFAAPAGTPPVSPLPALRRGHVTFGSLNCLSKVNGRVIDLWCAVMRALPEARLIMFRNTLIGATRDEIRSHFTERGIAAERIDLRQGTAAPGYLAVYEDIDVTLDTFPATGGVTTCESLWMGVPVLTLCGVRPVARHSAAILTSVGLSDWIAATPEQYVALAAKIPGQLDQLAKVRANLRERMGATICDARRFTAELENAYRTMWRRWCARQQPATM